MGKNKTAQKIIAKNSLTKSLSRKARETWVAVSGGFDPVHIGHVRMFEQAKKMGGKLVVILNNDNWLCTKKGYAFMPEHERKEVIEGFRAVDRVVLTCHSPNDPDRSVSRELAKVRPAIFANGGDRKNVNDIPEGEVCKRHGIRMVFNIGRGGKVQSSSWLTGKIPPVAKKGTPQELRK